MDLLTIAKNIADRVEDESVEHDVPVAVTVIDTHGNVVLTHRMTGAPAFSLELAERKAYTSALVGVRTADLVPLVQPGAALYPLLAVSGGRYSAMGGGVPLTSDGQVIARGRNLGRTNGDPTAHGEMVAIRRCLAEHGSAAMRGSTLYTSGEPCAMCMGAILWCGISRLVYGASLAESRPRSGRSWSPTLRSPTRRRLPRSRSPAGCSRRNRSRCSNEARG